MKNKDNLFMTNKGSLFMAIAYLILALVRIYSEDYWTAVFWFVLSAFMFVVYLYYRKKSKRNNQQM